MNNNFLFKISAFLFLSFSYSQSHTLSGVVLDIKNNPLENANIIAIPKKENTTIKFAIADNKGRYKLEIDSKTKYEITVSFIGYKEQVLFFEPNSLINNYDFILTPTGENLKEIVIKHDYKPIIIKKDTLVYDAKSFTNGNERKLKELLEKLPGVEVDKKGKITVQGKKVTKFLVEDKSFFGGGTKLGIENIPADAVDKVEVIDHFNSVGFIKQVSDSQDLAVNIKLKKDKKKFIFGDILSSIPVAFDTENYLAHTGLFYYTPKINFSYIGDVNNINKNTFTFEDLIRFEGGYSSLFNGRKSLSDLFTLINDNNDFIKSESKFSAINFNSDINSKINLSGFCIFSKSLLQSINDYQNIFLQNNTTTFENKLQNNENKTTLGIVNIKLDYSISKNNKIFYNIQYQTSNNNSKNKIDSETNLDTNYFNSISNTKNSSIKQFIEWHKYFNKKYTSTFVINHVFEKSNPEINWMTNQLFFTNLIPLESDSSYQINQIKSIKNQSLDFLYKMYWIINYYNHLYFNIGNNFENSNYSTSEKQLLTNDSINDFSNSGFGNKTRYNLNDSYIGLEYKFKIGKWTNKPGIYLHYNNLNVTQSNNISISKILIQPQYDSEFNFSNSESLTFNYKLINSFAESFQYSENYSLQSYNQIFKGNALLENEKYHNINLYYSKINMYRGILLNGILTYSKKVLALRNEVVIEGINQYNKPFLTNNPENNLRLNGSISKKIHRFNLKLNTTLSWFNYFQTINSVTKKNERKFQNFGLTLKTASKKWPDISIGFSKGFIQFNGLSNSTFQTDEFNSDAEINLSKSLIFKIEYINLKNADTYKLSNYYDNVNSSIRFQKKNSPFTFELFANNLFNNQYKNNFSLNDYMITNQKTYVLPRVFMFSVNYKL